MYSQVTANGAPALTQHCGSCSPSPAALHPMFSLSQQESHYRQLPMYEDVAYPSPSSNLCSRLYTRASFTQMIKWKWGLLESLYACILSCFSRVAAPSSRGSSRPRDGTCISYVSCIDRWALSLPLAPPGKPTYPRGVYSLLEKHTAAYTQRISN